MATTSTRTPEVSHGFTPGAHIADPAPLGLAAFALTTFFLSFVNAGLVPATVEPVVFGLALAYGGAAQFAAGLWEFAKGNTFGATAFCSYGSFWLSFWWLTAHLADYKIPAADVGKGVGLYLVAGALLIKSSPAPAIDVFTLEQRGAAELIAGQNPYAIDYPNPYDATDTRNLPAVDRDSR